MDFIVANQDFENVALIDVYESMLWVDRYNEYGDFELYISAHDPILQFLKQDYYIFKQDSEHVMIIEGMEIRSDFENGDRAIITGRSLESILDRRIIWNKKTIADDTNVQTAIKTLLNEAIINPSDVNRKISNFIFRDSTDTRINEMKFGAQYTGDNLYDVICEICEAFHLGWKITLENKQFIFELYYGQDRTYDQTVNPYVIFSPKFENIINSDYLESTKTLRNITLVAGEESGNNRKTYTVVREGESTPTGLLRRELYTDARDISSTTESGSTLTPTQYNNKLKQRGIEKLADNVTTKDFEGKVESTILFVYQRDFFMGDLIQIENEYGIGGTARIIEFIVSIDANGIETYPTFQSVDE